MTRLHRLPVEILAIDWGSTSAKRQMCRAVLLDGRYVFSPPRSVPDVAALELGPGTLAAFDCPIGVSRDYAAMAQLHSFRAALGVFGNGRFGRFYEFADCSADIATERPFYPKRGVQGVSSRMRHVTMDLRGELVTVTRWTTAAAPPSRAVAGR